MFTKLARNIKLADVKFGILCLTNKNVPEYAITKRRKYCVVSLGA